MGQADLHIHTTSSYDGTATVAATLTWVAGRTALDVIAITDHDAIDGALGGLAIATHPGGHWAGCLSAQCIRRALGVSELAEVLVGGEEHNASLPLLSTNRLGRRIVAANRLAPIASSDAHMLAMIGLGQTAFAGNTQADLRRALVTGATHPLIGRRPWYYGASFVHRQTLRNMGWAQSIAAQSNTHIALRRLSALRPSTLSQVRVITRALLQGAVGRSQRTHGRDRTSGTTAAGIHQRISRRPESAPAAHCLLH